MLSSVARFAGRRSLVAAVRTNRLPLLQARLYADAPQGSTGKIPELSEQVTGLQGQEHKAHSSGGNTFGYTEGTLTGPFGTEDAPVKVPSHYDRRIVGCVGGTGDKAHDLLWHEVKEGRPVVCMACGQFFELERQS